MKALIHCEINLIPSTQRPMWVERDRRKSFQLPIQSLPEDEGDGICLCYLDDPSHRGAAFRFVQHLRRAILKTRLTSDFGPKLHRLMNTVVVTSHD